ncbi:unnamed protein product [Closterium sp. NIES-64]|nr:unnamed protein product [Closterium sp. NIES-64]
MYVVDYSEENEGYRCFQPDPGIGTAALVTCEAAALGASASAALRYWMWGFTSSLLRRQRVTHCTEARTGRHLATFSRRPGSSLYTLTVESPPVPAYLVRWLRSGQVLAAASRSVLSLPPVLVASCLTRLSCGTTVLATPPCPRLRSMASRVLVSRSSPVSPSSPLRARTFLLSPCVEGRLRATPHSSHFPPTEAPLQTFTWMCGAQAPVRGQGYERYFLLVVTTTRVTPTVLPLRSKDAVTEGKVGDASVFRVWGSRAFVRDLSADKLSPRAAPCVFLGFPTDAPGCSFTTPPLVVFCPPRTSRSTSQSPSTVSSPTALLPSPLPPDFLVPTPLTRSRLLVTLVLLRVLSLGVLTLGVLCAGVLMPGGATAGGAGLRVLLRRVRSLGVLSRGAAVPGGAGSGGAGSGAAEPGGAELGAAEPGGAASGAAEPGVSPAAASRREAPLSTGAARVVRSPLEAVLLSLEVLLELELELSRPSRVLLSVVSLRLARVACSCCSRLVVAGSRQRPPPVPGTHRMSLRPSTAPLRAPLPSPPESSLPALADPESDSLRAASPTSLSSSTLLLAVVSDYAASLVAESASVCPPSVGGECALGTDVLEDRQEELQCLAAASPHLASVLLAPEGDPDALDIPTPRSYAEAVEGPYSSQWQAAMDAEMASWKSTGTYVDAVPPPGANIVSGMWIFRVKRPPGSPPVFKARYVARGFSQRQGVDYFQTFSPTPKMTTLRVLLHIAAQRDYELHSLDFSTAFLQGSLHEEIWLRRPPGFTGTFPPGTQWSLRRPVYGLRQAPREWHDTLRTTLAALGFAPSTADPSLFLRTDTSLPPFYILVYVDDLVFATADTAGLAYVKSELLKRHTCTDLGELRSYLGLQITRDRARRTITLTQSHMVQQVLQRFGFTYSSPQATPLPTRHSLSALPSDESVESSGPYAELTRAHGCSEEGIALPVQYVGHGASAGGRSPVVLTGHADASWADDQATQRSSQGYTFSLGSGSVSWRSTRSSSVLGSSCEAEIYAGAMAAQELRWLTYLLTDLGEPPRSPPVLYVDNKAMLALCREQRLEHRTKHIALRYFLARELQQRGQLRLAYVASEANTADVFTKALAPCDHQRFCTQLGLVPVLPHLLSS